MMTLTNDDACIDAHQHFWEFSPVRDAWITEEMRVIRRDFGPEDLRGVLEANGVSGCVAVQADPSEAETAFLVDIARRHPFVKGVVGWVDLCAPDVASRLAYYRETAPEIKGFRHIVQAEPDAFMDGAAFSEGISQLAAYGYPYDILIYPRQLPAALRLAARFPDQPFVIDHLAKPDIRSGGLEPWRRDIRRIAAYPRVHCKVSGMVTEADWDRWTPGDLKPYLDVVFEAFGPRRLLFGSDWPVCLVASDYARVKGVLDEYLQACTPAERRAVMGGNAAAFYALDRRTESNTH